MLSPLQELHAIYAYRVISYMHDAIHQIKVKAILIKVTLELLEQTDVKNCPTEEGDTYKSSLMLCIKFYDVEVTYQNAVSTCHSENSSLVEDDNGNFSKNSKGRHGRYLIVYPDDSVLMSKYHLSIPHDECSDDSQNSEFQSKVKLCVQGIEKQKVKKNPFTVIKNPKRKKLLQPSRTGNIGNIQSTQPLKYCISIPMNSE
ncbi:unnamed protein product [Mytilus edulis]|uniref:Uncharacterized protein n=1 Tax=Mytilus edulis TaxID=6550 RepID=A0A8S3R337_MYTED|nr:unnamed protein product [Mytilus edulis]